MLPMLKDFDVVVPSLPGYGFSPRPPRVGINYRYVSERWHRLMSELGYSRYGAGGHDFGSGVTTILAPDHPEPGLWIHPTTLEPDTRPPWADRARAAAARLHIGGTSRGAGHGVLQSAATARSSPPSRRPLAMDSTTPRRDWPPTWARNGTRGATSRRPTTSSAPRSRSTGSRRPSPRRCATI